MLVKQVNRRAGEARLWPRPPAATASGSGCSRALHRRGRARRLHRARDPHRSGRLGGGDRRSGGPPLPGRAGRAGLGWGGGCKRRSPRPTAEWGEVGRAQSGRTGEGRSSPRRRAGEAETALARARRCAPRPLTRSDAPRPLDLSPLSGARATGQPLPLTAPAPPRRRWLRLGEQRRVDRQARGAGVLVELRRGGWRRRWPRRRWARAAPRPARTARRAAGLLPRAASALCTASRIAGRSQFCIAPLMESLVARVLRPAAARPAGTCRRARPAPAATRRSARRRWRRRAGSPWPPAGARAASTAAGWRRSARRPAARRPPRFAPATIPEADVARLARRTTSVSASMVSSSGVSGS